MKYKIGDHVRLTKDAVVVPEFDSIITAAMEVAVGKTSVKLVDFVENNLPAQVVGIASRPVKMIGSPGGKVVMPFYQVLVFFQNLKDEKILNGCYWVHERHVTSKIAGSDAQELGLSSPPADQTQW